MPVKELLAINNSKMSKNQIINNYQSVTINKAALILHIKDSDIVISRQPDHYSGLR